MFFSILIFVLLCIIKVSWMFLGFILWVICILMNCVNEFILLFCVFFFVVLVILNVILNIVWLEIGVWFGIL